MNLPIDRSSACAGDDIDSHCEFLDISPKDSLKSVIDRILSQRYLPAISGGRATWIVESGRPTHTCMIAHGVATFIPHHGRPFAVIAQQWPDVHYLVSKDSPVDEIIESGKGLFFNYWCQSDPDLVLDCLKNGEALPDRYGRSKT